MAASLLGWMANGDNKVLSEEEQQQQQQDLQTKAHHHLYHHDREHDHHQVNAKQTRGRNKSARNSAQKRPPQRGLGVAQLERLRLQERWKKMTELDQSQPQSHVQAQAQAYHHHHHQEVLHQHHAGSSNHRQYHHHQFQFQFQFPLPFSGRQAGASSSSVAAYPKCVSATSNYGSVVSDGHHRHQSSLMFQYPYAGSGSTTSAGITMASSELHEADRIRIVAGELSSSQKMQYGLFEQFQIKGINDEGENLGFRNGRRSAQFHHVDNTIPAVDNCDLLSLNLGRQSSILDGSRGHNNIRQLSCYSSTNVKEGVEVVAVHRRGSPMGTSVLMEYEFFPCRSSSSSSSSSSNYNRNSSIVEAQPSPSPVVMTEASPSNNTNTSSTNWVDLSLRLSC